MRPELHLVSYFGNKDFAKEDFIYRLCASLIRDKRLLIVQSDKSFTEIVYKIGDELRQTRNMDWIDLGRYVSQLSLGLKRKLSWISILNKIAVHYMQGDVILISEITCDDLNTLSTVLKDWKAAFSHLKIIGIVNEPVNLGLGDTCIFNPNIFEYLHYGNRICTMDCFLHDIYNSYHVEFDIDDPSEFRISDISSS